MTTWIGRTVGATSALMLLSGGRLRTHGAVVFAYHDVDDDPANRTEFLVTPRQLREQLSTARAWGLRFVDLRDLCDGLARGDDVDGLGAVSFDDSLLGVHRQALPVLGDLGIRATIFVATGVLEQEPPWWPGAKRTMSQRELQELVAAGHRLGSHTITHASLPELRDQDLTRELRDSRLMLEDLVARPVDLLAYPSGHHDARVCARAAAEGYRAAFTFLNGRVTHGVDCFRIPRLTVDGHERWRLAYHLARPDWSWPAHQGDAGATSS